MLPTSVLNRNVKEQRTIRLAPLKALRPDECAYEELKDSIHQAAAVNRGGPPVTPDAIRPLP